MAGGGPHALLAAIPSMVHPVASDVPAINAVPGIYGEQDNRINAGIPEIEAAMTANNKIYEKWYIPMPIMPLLILAFIQEASPGPADLLPAPWILDLMNDKQMQQKKTLNRRGLFYYFRVRGQVGGATTVAGITVNPATVPIPIHICHVAGGQARYPDPQSDRSHP
jgi:hypothetical protein